LKTPNTSEAVREIEVHRPSLASRRFGAAEAAAYSSVPAEDGVMVGEQPAEAHWPRDRKPVAQDLSAQRLAEEIRLDSLRVRRFSGCSSSDKGVSSWSVTRRHTTIRNPLHCNRSAMSLAAIAGRDTFPSAKRTAERVRVFKAKQACGLIELQYRVEVKARHLVPGFVQNSLEPVPCILQPALYSAGTHMGTQDDRINGWAMSSQPVLSRSTHEFDKSVFRFERWDGVRSQTQAVWRRGCA
jgi:hypothetical protein